MLRFDRQGLQDSGVGRFAGGLAECQTDAGVSGGADSVAVPGAVLSPVGCAAVASGGVFRGGGVGGIKNAK